MIKTFIKHHIYEKCIDIIFDGITKAFQKPDLNDELFNIRLSIYNSLMKYTKSKDNSSGILSKEYVQRTAFPR